MLLRVLGASQTHLRKHMTVDIKRKRSSGKAFNQKIGA